MFEQLELRLTLSGEPVPTPGNVEVIPIYEPDGQEVRDLEAYRQEQEFYDEVDQSLSDQVDAMEYTYWDHIEHALEDLYHDWTETLDWPIQPY